MAESAAFGDRPGVPAWVRNPAPLYDASLPVSELFEDFLAASASIVSDGTITGYRYDFRQLTDWLAESGIEPVLGSLTKQCLVDYIAALQHRPKAKGRGSLSSHSVHHYARVVRTFMRWLVSEGYYPFDPLAGGKRGPMPRTGPRVLKMASVADIERLLSACDGRDARDGLERATAERDKVIVLLTSDTGMRTGELCRLTLADVDFEDGWALVRKGKWDRERRVPLSRATVSALRLYLRRARPRLSGIRAGETLPTDFVFVSIRGDAVTPNGIYEAMCRRWSQSGAEGRFGLHRIRHLFGTTAVAGGMHPRVSQEIMGHEDAKSQAPYLHPAASVLRDQHAQVTPLRSLPARRRRSLAEGRG